MLEYSVIVGVIVGLTEVIKRAFKVKKRFIPLTAVILGVLISFIDFRGVESIIFGIIAGLTSVGLYSGVKNSLDK